MNEKCTNKRLGKLIGLYEFGALDASQQRGFLDHLVDCEYCHNQVYSMDPITASFREQRAAARLNRPRRSPAEARSVVRVSRLWFFQPAIPAAIVLLLLVGAGSWIVWREMSGPSRHEKLARLERMQVPKAVYVPPQKPVPMREPEKMFSSAMEAYQRDDFETAIEQLETINLLQPLNRREVNSYLGISLMLVGRSSDAIAPLSRVIESGNGPLAEKSGFYLALAYVKTGQVKEAISAVDATIVKGGEYLAQAKQLKEELSDIPE